MTIAAVDNESGVAAASRDLVALVGRDVGAIVAIVAAVAVLAQRTAGSCVAAATVVAIAAIADERVIAAAARDLVALAGRDVGALVTIVVAVAICTIRAGCSGRAGRSALGWLRDSKALCDCVDLLVRDAEHGKQRLHRPGPIRRVRTLTVGSSGQAWPHCRRLEKQMRNRRPPNYHGRADQ